MPERGDWRTDINPGDSPVVGVEWMAPQKFGQFGSGMWSTMGNNANV
jgi:hypothetical protein